MKFTGATLFISAAYVASLVSATSIVSITSPLLNQKYKAGSEAIISWINPTVATIPQIVLAKGPSTALQPIMTIATNVNAQDMKYVWKIPFEIENGSECKLWFITKVVAYTDKMLNFRCFRTRKLTWSRIRWSLHHWRWCRRCSPLIQQLLHWC